MGDALGVPYEFTHHIETVEWRGYGTHHQKPGTWSDDGALMLATLDSLLDVGFDTADQARRFLAWRDHKAYTPNGDGAFDIGGATGRALARLRSGVAPEEAGNDPDALGNGSLMRILPIALVGTALGSAELVVQAHRSSRITHGAPGCLTACALYVLVARRLLDGDRDRATALEGSTHALREEYGRIGDVALADALEALVGWPGREGRGHVSDSFWSAWDAFAGAHDYRSAVVRAVRYGNDTDTTAAIAGGLAGLYFGETDIPADWRRNLRGPEVSRPLVDRVARRLDASHEPQLPAIDPDYPYATNDLERIHDYREWHRLHG